MKGIRLVIDADENPIRLTIHSNFDGMKSGEVAFLFGTAIAGLENAVVEMARAFERESVAVVALNFIRSVNDASDWEVMGDGSIRTTLQVKP